MKGMGDLVRQAQMMQKKMSQMQDDMAKRTVEASAGGGMVTVTVTGAQDVVAIKIDKSVVDPNDVDMLQDLVLAAVSDAIKKSKEMAAAEMQQLTGGMKIPGLF